MTPNPQESITLVGAGLVGSLLSLFLAKKGLRVTIYERRADLRKVPLTAGRSINLALANRGIFPLEQVGIMDAVKPLLIPMGGRKIHEVSGDTKYLPYGQRPHEVIYSVSRTLLTGLLLDAAEKTGLVEVRFNEACQGIDFARRELLLSQGKVPFERLIATDGSSSVLRKSLVSQVGGECTEEELGHGYKELTLPALPSGGFALEKNALHIWPRGEFMLIGLPNLDGSFTLTLFMPNAGDESFATFSQDRSKLPAFLKTNFPDLLSIAPQLEDEFSHNPTGHLSTVRCNPWRYQDRVLLLGDSAHGIVPFHGQGMNCGFEDCAVFSECFDLAQSWDEVFSSVERERKPNCDAIADLALENYIEMRSSVRDPKFQLQKELSFELEKRFPTQFIPRYSMVMFHRIPYAQAKSRGIIQQTILDTCTQGISSLDQVNWSQASSLVEKKLPL